MTHHTEYDVLIVGAGLVGASLAAALLQDEQNAQLRIALLDRAQAPSLPDLSAHSPQFDPRVVALTPHSQQFFQSLGVWDCLPQARLCPYQRMCVWDDEGTGEIEFVASDLQVKALGNIVESNVLLDSVLARLDDYPQLDIIRGESVVSIQQHERYVDVNLANQKKITARLLVAADGARSHIRQLVGLEPREWSYDQEAIVATVKTDQAHQYTAWQNFRHSGPLAFLPLANPHYCSIVWSLDTPEARFLMELEQSAFDEALSKAIEYRLGHTRVQGEKVSIPLTQRHLPAYFSASVVLAGDAAHTIHPLAGQGVNLGLLDVQVLAQEIARANRRKLAINDPSVLRRYQRQRKPHNMQMMVAMEGFKRLFGSSQIQLRWMRNQGLNTVNQMSPLKNWLAKQAMGI